MKKVTALSCLLFLILLAGCSKRTVYELISENGIPLLSDLITYDYPYQTQRYTEDFFDALSDVLPERDETAFREKMRKLFSQSTQDTVPAFDLSVRHLYGIFEEQTVTEVQLEPRSESNRTDSGKRIVETLLTGSCQTETNTYYLKIQITLVNDEDPTKEGITGVAFYREEDALRGLYCPAGLFFDLDENAPST